MSYATLSHLSRRAARLTVARIENASTHAVNDNANDDYYASFEIEESTVVIPRQTMAQVVYPTTARQITPALARYCAMKTLANRNLGWHARQALVQSLYARAGL